MSVAHKKNLPVSVSRVKNLDSVKRHNLVYLGSAMLFLFGVAALVSVVSL